MSQHVLQRIFPGRVVQQSAVLALASALIAFALQLGLAGRTGSQLMRAPNAPAPAAKGLSSLPLAAQGTISAAMGADGAAFRVNHSGGSLTAGNRDQRFHSTFSASGVAVSAGTARLSMTLQAVGAGTALQPVAPASPRAHANRVAYDRGALREWYANGPLGLEQGFTVARAPSAAGPGPLTVALRLSGNTHAALAPGAQVITFRGQGRLPLSYGALVATDAHGRALHSWLELHGAQLLVRVDAQGARYPVRIDPLLQHGNALGQQGSKLSGGGETGAGDFAFSVALSADGNTALIGAPFDNSSAGAAWVFTRTGSTWAQQGEKLTGAGEVGAGRFGRSVALSADGGTALIGATTDNTVGAGFVFTRSGTTWTQQGSKLTGTGHSGTGEGFGWSVALSADGNTALIAGPGDNASIGAVWGFTRSGSAWTQQGSKLTPTGAAGPVTQFGYDVALSADGNTALIGGDEDNKEAGAAWVFTRSGGTWAQQGSKLTGSGEAGNGELGASVALSASGNTALIGAPSDNEHAGAAWVFTRSGESWSQHGGKLTGGGEAGQATFGISVALGADGNIALIGGSGDNGVGAAWVFIHQGFLWTQENSKLTGSGESGKSGFGRSVALSSDGNVALIGGPNDNPVPAENVGVGAAWVFEPKLTGSGASGTGFLGARVAVSADGGTALVGAYGDAGGAGAAWFFERTGSAWKQLGAKVTGGGEIGSGRFGIAVALSADGGTALIGADRDNGGVGAAWMFYPNPVAAEQVGPKLTGGGEVGAGGFGHGVALSSDGSTVLIGGNTDNAGAGAAWVFTHLGATITQQAKLTGTGESGEASFAGSVALSSDGNTALLGGPSDTSNTGAAWAFTRSGSTWTQQGAKLTGGGETAGGYFGSAVALSSDGNTALIGGSLDNSSTGAAWAFTRSGAVWSQQGSKLGGTGEQGAGQLGEYVALSADGNTALIGGPTDNKFSGAAWLFKRVGSMWMQQGEKLTAGGQSASDAFGVGVALSGDASTALVGGGGDPSGRSAAWVFVSPPTVTKLKPASGPVGGGTTVTITGVDLAGAWGVQFGSTSAASFKVNSLTSITAVAPPSAAGIVDVRVNTVDGITAVSTKDRFKFKPTVTGVTPNEGTAAGGTTVTITGTGFGLGQTATTIKFGTAKAEGVECTSSSTCTATAPAHAAGTVDVTVTVNKAASPKTPADKFTYV